MNVVVLVAVALAAPDAAREAKQSRTRVSPLALEFKLLAELARTGSAPKEVLTERALFLKRYGGAGYKIGAGSPERDPEDEQRKAREQAYMALTEPYLRATAASVKEFIRKWKMRFKPGRAAEHREDRAYRAFAYIEGADAEIEKRKAQIKALERTPIDPLARGVEDAVRIREQIAQINVQIDRLKELVKELRGYISAVSSYDEFAADIRTKGIREDLAKKAEDRAKKLAEKAPKVLAAIGVGSQQTRFVVNEEVRDEILRGLGERLVGERGRGSGKVGFLKGPLDFLPQARPAPPQAPPEKKLKGDYHITDYVCGDEVFLTVFDAFGLWYPITALEFEGGLDVLLPPAEEEKKGRR